MIGQDHEFSCPYCGEVLSVRLDETGGEEQEFVYDCEVCCKPIHIVLELDNGQVVDFQAEAES